MSASTKMGVPSSPWNVTAKQISHSEVVVRWNAPVRPNGLITGYKVFVEPTVPSLIVNTMPRNTEVLISYRFAAGSNYSFEVVAENHYAVSAKSARAYLVFDASAVILPVKDLKASDISNSSVTLTWSAPSNDVTGYQILVKTATNFYAQYPAINTTATSWNVTDLSPGVRYTFEVSALRDPFIGPPSAAIATTTGDELLSVANLKASLVKSDLTTVKLEWSPPKDKRKLKWEYGIYYGVSLKVFSKSSPL